MRVPVLLVVAALVALSTPSTRSAAPDGSAAPAAPAGNEVDALVARLSELTLARVEHWKVSDDLKKSGLDEQGDAPAAPSFDDTAWSSYALDARTDHDACWFRRTIVLPAFASGRKVAGKVTLDLGVDDAAEVFVDGVRRAKFGWTGTVELTSDAKPGDRFLVAIRALNTGGPLRLFRAGLSFEDPAMASTRRAVEDLSLSLRVAQKLLSFDTYQTNARRTTDPRIDRSTLDRAEKERLAALLARIAGMVDSAALARGDLARYDASIALVAREIAPIAAFARRFTLHFDANAHIDAAWLWREKETVEVCRRTFASVMNMFRARPDFTYTQSAAAYYDWMERLDPDLFREIKQRIAEGRWEVVGGMWVEPDCNLPSGESWARHLLYGKGYFRDKVGVDVKIGWNPDSFGYHANMPALYARAGIEAFITQKIGWNDTTVFPHRVFWWQSKDGSRVLSYFPFDYVNEVDDPFRLVDWMRQFEANTGFRKMLVLFGVGDHGGGPSLEMIDRIERLKTLLVYPSIEYGTATTYLDWLRAQDLATLPVWTDELYLEYHQGTFTTQAATKAANQRAQTRLGDAETFAALATLTGRTYPAADLQDGWRHAMFNQFHDILPGSSIREVYVDAAARYREVDAIAAHERAGALAALAGAVDTRAAKGTPLVVFNRLSWTRTDAVAAELPEGDDGPWSVFDARGREVPSQVVAGAGERRYERTLLFVAREVPALGYALYDLRREAPAATVRGELAVAADRAENAFVRVFVDPKTGWLSSVFDRTSGRELLAGPGNELQVLEDRPQAWDAWNIGLTGRRHPTVFRGVEVVENGPVRAVLRVRHDYLEPGTKKEYPTEDFPTSFFTQDIVLWEGLPRVEFRTDADWWEKKTMLKVAFPLAVNAAEARDATFDIPYGTIRRSTGNTTPAEKGQIEVPAQRWADLSDARGGASVLTVAKHGFDVKGQTIRLSLLRAPIWPDPTADRGHHEMVYALYPHAGAPVEAGTVQRAAELDAPLAAIPTGRHPGRWPARHGFVSIAPSNLVIAGLKKAERGDAWVLRWYDVSGRDSLAVITLPAAPRRAVVSNLLEEDGAEVPVDGTTIRVPTGHDAIVTLKLTF